MAIVLIQLSDDSTNNIEPNKRRHDNDCSAGVLSHNFRAPVFCFARNHDWNLLMPESSATTWRHLFMTSSFRYYTPIYCKVSTYRVAYFPFNYLPSNELGLL